MNRERKQKLRQATIFTFLLFGALTAMAGIFMLVPAEAPAITDAPKTDIPASAEVFSPINQPEDTTVFAGFLPPLTGRISSEYGYREDPFTGEVRYHKGVDVAVEEGTQVVASAGGTVSASAYDGIGGNFIVIDHGNGTESYYGHLRTRTVAKGDRVERGQGIGLSGSTGKTTGPHLHFQLSYRNRTVDPLVYLELEAK